MNVGQNTAQYYYTVIRFLVTAFSIGLIVEFRRWFTSQSLRGQYVLATQRHKANTTKRP